jgi:signal transduction histidine kinase
VQGQEEERKSISRELHDEIGQMLTALRMELRGLQDLRTAPEDQFNEHLETAKRLGEQSLRSLRDMAMGLRPSMLDDLGLGSALQWQARQFARQVGIPVNVNIAEMPNPIPEGHRICVYRIVQEALTNCARHAGAKRIDIDVEGRSGGISVFIRDDGVGFDPAKVKGRGLGLLGMQERVRDLGGHLVISSRPGEGTVVSAKLPLAKEVSTDGHPSTVG